MTMIKVRALAGVLGLAATGALALAGCSRNDVPSRAASDPNATSGSRAYADAPMSGGTSGGRETERASYGSNAGGANYGGSSYAARAPRAPVPMFDGEPMWSDSRQHTAQENAQYHCSKSGGDIGASSLNECLKKIHAFLDHPPEDVQKLKRASNGDTLLYDPKENLFAVARRDGAPRTFFKPRDGAQYWKEQQDREASGGSSYSRRSTGGGASDEG